jgi:flagellin
METQDASQMDEQHCTGCAGNGAPFRRRFRASGIRGGPMIAGLSSSVALATRTAGQARERMDTAARQVATGQRVASVKDDGAAWTRAATTRSEAKRYEVLQGWMANATARIDASMAVRDVELSGLDQLADLTRAAMGTAAGSAARAGIGAAVAALIDDTRVVTPPTGELFDPALGITAMLYQADSFTAGTTVNYSRPDYLYSSFDVDPDFASYETKTEAQLAATLAKITNWQDIIRGAQASTGTDRARATATGIRASQFQTRLEQQAASLTDANLGKASSTLEQSQVRQQLALDTVRSAISAYGNLANGLMGNIARTQRGVMA